MRALRTGGASHRSHRMLRRQALSSALPCPALPRNAAPPRPATHPLLLVREHADVSHLALELEARLVLGALGLRGGEAGERGRGRGRRVRREWRSAVRWKARLGGKRAGGAGTRKKQQRTARKNPSWKGAWPCSPTAQSVPTNMPASARTHLPADAAVGAAAHAGALPDGGEVQARPLPVQLPRLGVVGARRRLLAVKWTDFHGAALRRGGGRVQRGKEARARVAGGSKAHGGTSNHAPGMLAGEGANNSVARGHAA